jgi:hypothetical protein
MKGSALHASVETALGIYSTSPTCHLTALARVDDYRLDDLQAAIEKDRTLVRIRAMRYSVYTLTRTQLAIVEPATRAVRMRLNASVWRRIEAHYPSVARQIEAALADGPLSTAELRSRIDTSGRLGPDLGVIIGRMGAESRIVRALNTGGWRSDQLAYARWEDWVGDHAPLEEKDAQRRLVEEYVNAYGPVTPEDVRWWTGWSVAETTEAIDGLDLTSAGSALEDLPGVRLLPVWDVLMVAYRERDRLFEPKWAPFIYDRFGNATSVVLSDGRVVGVWDLGRSDDPLQIRVAPFGDWTSRISDGVEAQAHRIADLIGAGEVSVEQPRPPVDLVDAPRNRFLAPLG